jgi:penicillin amidase
MRILKPICGLLLAFTVTIGLNEKVGQMPPIAKFLDPYRGVWQNALDDTLDVTKISGLNNDVRLVIDDRDVPHIFSQDDHDLYFMQGFLTARDRLWQMEFQTHAAAGRLSEIIGQRTTEFDLEQRRIGMVWAAERSLELVWKDSVSRSVIEAYVGGVNAYIASMDERKLPLEYKLLDYRPESWTPLKCALLMKYMAKMLTGSERDMANTELLKLLGPVLFDQLYPEQNRLEDPIVPGFKVDVSADPSVQAYMNGGSWNTIDPQPSYVGSNNWAVSGKRTANGNAILCNDPHLKLGLPSIWYEVQLHAPGINCYGVSLPGAPGIVIGFNDRIAWGVTNAGRDVKDYFALNFKDAEHKSYKYGELWKQTTTRLEEVKVRGEKSVIDTVIYTHYGPVAYQNDSTGKYLALRWAAHEPSNELKAFYGLNRASGYNDYERAIRYFACPGQNFVYADIADTIAIWQQGDFLDRPKDHGRFILDGADPSLDITTKIPQVHNPHMVNPSRGFVSSANQAPTDSTYPYYYTGVFEEFRNRTINDHLRKDSTATVESMMALQNSNFNLLAKEALPLMLSLLDTNDFQNKRSEMMAVYTLLTWDYSNERGIIGPTVFEVWWDEFNSLLWDELNDPKWDQAEYYRYSWEEFGKTGKAHIDLRDSLYVYPNAMVTIDLLKNHQDADVFDHRFTPDKKENARDLMYDAFYWTAMKLSDIITYHFDKPHWGHYKGTRVEHLMRLEALSSPSLFIGGSEHAPNAITSSHGPSWRMVVEMHPDGPRGFGVLPGGQSGNPGNSGYMLSLMPWMKGEYHPLHRLKTDDLESGKWQVLTIRSSKAD